MDEETRSLQGRHALVTGGTRGIGRGVAMELARRGADVAVMYRRDDRAAEQTLRDLGGTDGRTMAIKGDVGRVEDCHRAAEEAFASLGTIDIFVHSAGTAAPAREVSDTASDAYLDAMAVHGLGAAYLARELLPRMRQCQRGDIVLVSSAMPPGGAPLVAPYAMAKAAAEALARTLAHEERRHGVRVNVVRPGFTETEMGRRLLLHATGHDDFRRLDATRPFGRVGQPEDVGRLVAFLVSDAGSYITNQVISIDGGESTIDGRLDLNGE